MKINSLELQQSLLSWFEKHKRPMPWRESSNPYHIWISEIMLQQTQVKTVEAYYKRFIQYFPDIQKLAAADIHDIMKAWEGLGYYSRARNIHLTAKEIVNRFHGKVPDTLDDLLSLPGIGKYTAGAILSIAYGKKAPILDGNVIRLLTRLFHITDNVNQSSTQKILWSLAESLLPDEHLREFSEGLMEIGATICKPDNPLCEKCPINFLCQSKALDIQEELPVKSPKKPVPHYDVVAGMINHKSKFLITLRPPKGLLGGLWEFPGGKVKVNESFPDALKREIEEELNLNIHVGELLISIKHAYTHFKITLHVFRCEFKGGEIILNPDAAVDYRWITVHELDDYAFPGANRKVINMVKLHEDIN